MSHVENWSLSENELAILKSQNPQTFITSTMINEVISEMFSAHEALDVEERDEARAKTILRLERTGVQWRFWKGRETDWYIEWWMAYELCWVKLVYKPGRHPAFGCTQYVLYFRSIKKKRNKHWFILPQPTILIYQRLSGYKLTRQTKQSAKLLWLFLMAGISSMRLQKKRLSFEIRN